MLFVLSLSLSEKILNSAEIFRAPFAELASKLRLSEVRTVVPRIAAATLQSLPCSLRPGIRAAGERVK